MFFEATVTHCRCFFPSKDCVVEAILAKYNVFFVEAVLFEARLANIHGFHRKQTGFFSNDGR